MSSSIHIKFPTFFYRGSSINRKLIFQIHFIFFILISVNILNGQTIPLTSYVNPQIGSKGDGHIFIGPSCPFGMVKPGPDNSVAANSGYVADSTIPIYGFSQLHVSGTGGGPKYGNISVMPFTGKDDIYARSNWSQQKVSLGLYAVYLNKYQIHTEITTSQHSSLYKFIFNKSSNKTNEESTFKVKIDGGIFLGEKPTPNSREAQQFVGSSVQVLSDSSLQGYSRIRGGWNNGRAYTVYYYVIFDHKFSSFSTWHAEQLYNGISEQEDNGEKTGAIVKFKANDLPGDSLKMRVGISFIGELNAKSNLIEKPNSNDGINSLFDFQKTYKSLIVSWQRYLSRIEIQCVKESPKNEKASTYNLDLKETEERQRIFNQKTMFYTALYHTMLMPTDRTGENPNWENTTPYYDDFYAIWDTYRCSSPLLTLIAPDREVAIVNALLQIYAHDGYLPDARSGNDNGRTQGGSNAEIVIADAFVKHLKGIDYKLAMEAMLKDAEVPPGGNEEKEGRGGLTDYNSLGYVSHKFVRSGNRTIEYAYDDYCIATVAKGLKMMDVYKRYIRQANNWQNLWRNISDHGSRGFIMPRDADGKWVDSIDCGIVNGRHSKMAYNTPLSKDWPTCVCWWCGVFYEASSWEYSFSIPHDIAAIIAKSGGKQAFIKKLNTLFDNHYYNVGNEPSFLTPDLYHFVGRPDLSSSRILEIIKKNFHPTSDGLPGNDDSGAMSSWFAFHQMGLYPNAGQPYYLINSPAYALTIIHLGNSKSFIIKAKNLSEKNHFIVAATLDGVPLNKSWISHEELMNGKILELTMAAVPNSWATGTSKQDLPPSLSNISLE